VTALSEQSFEPLYVELDGCLRFLSPDGTLRQGDTDVADSLTNASKTASSSP
jgi:hypothetical protein